MAKQPHTRKESGPSVSINLVSRSFLGSMTTPEKIRYILDQIKQNKILVLEEGLDPREEAELIQTTMGEIDHGSFLGIELESHRSETPNSWVQKLMQRSVQRSSMTVVGPAEKLKTVHKDGSVIQALIVGAEAAATTGA